MRDHVSIVVKNDAKWDNGKPHQRESAEFSRMEKKKRVRGIGAKYPERRYVNECRTPSK